MDTQILVNTIFELHKNTLKAQCIGTINGNNLGDYYPYIPTSPFVINQVINDLRLKKISVKGKNFIDIGCGVPIIPDIFTILGANTDGLEYNPLYCALYPQLLPGDLLTYDFKNYDILYSYNPLSNPSLMKEGIINIVNTMKKGAHFYFNLASKNTEILKELGFVGIPGNQNIAYLKKK